MDRLIAAGADVNAKGKDGMSLLLWAFPGDKLERFKKLLEHGADPNVIFRGGDPKDLMQGTFNSHGAFLPGDSVTHLACETGFPGYFEAVFSHGGDSNLIRSGKLGLKDTPLFVVIKFGRGDHKAQIRLLLDKGANINYINQTGSTPVMEAVSAGQYDVTLMLLNAGADYRIYLPRTNERLIHIVAGQEHRLGITPQQAADCQTLIKWLKDHGESSTLQKRTLRRWQSYHIGSADEYRRKLDNEIAEREAKEAVEKKAVADKQDQKP